MIRFFDKIIKFSFYFLLFFLPLFWLPFSFEIFEFNKIYLVLFLVSISFLAWLTKMIFFEKKVRFWKTPLNIPVFLFLLIATLSAIFSVDKNSSIFGSYGRFSNGLISLFSLVILYFLIINNSNIKRESNKNHRDLISINSSLGIFSWSVFFVILISYLSIFGIWQKIPNLPQIMSQKTFNPVSGSLEGLSVFLAVFIALLVGCLTSGFKKEKLSLISNYLLLIFSLGLLIIINFSIAWLILALSLIPFLFFALFSRIFKENINRLLLPIFLIFIAIAFLFFNFNMNFQLPREQVLDQATSWRVAFGTIKENVKSLFLGSGIGTYHYDFAKFKPIEWNQTLWWQIRFDRAGSHLAEIFGTMGFLGLISYLFLIGLFFLISWFFRKKIDSLPFFLTFLALFFSQVFYHQNLILAFTFWLILGLGVVSWERPFFEKVISLRDFPELYLILSTSLILLFLGVLTIYFFGVRFYLADVNFLKAQMVFLSEERTKFLENAIKLNPKFPNYWIISARNYLWQILEEAGRLPAGENLTRIQNLVATSIDHAKIATRLAPNSVAAWETLGMIYRDIQLLVSGATEWAIKSFQEAIKLEPKNPVLYTELGKLYLVSDLQKAREYFAKAKELKPDYPDALVQEALVFERENNLDEAIKRLEKIVADYPFSIEARFQLGRLYFNKDRIDEAISQFETNIQLMPNHSNSLYSLGLAYAKKGEKEKAIFAFEKVLELNPGNQDVIQKLEELKK